MKPIKATALLVGSIPNEISPRFADKAVAWCKARKRKFAHPGGPAPWAGEQWEKGAPRGAHAVAALCSGVRLWCRENLSPHQVAGEKEFERMVEGIEAKSIRDTGSPSWLC